jgi:hypothetical protein
MLVICAVLVMATGCVATGESASGTRTSTTRISPEELSAMQGQVNNLYQVVSRLRPRWLQGDVVVYQGQSLYGWKRSLEEFGLDSASYLTYLDRSEAVAQLPGLGSRHIDGAIVIHTR